MKNKTVLITGALSGIGHATALALGRQKFKLIVSGRREEAGHSVASELKALGAEAEFVQADVRKEADVKQLADLALQRFGRIDVAVNNSGVKGKLGLVSEQTVDDYYATFDTNVLGVLLSMKYELPVMIAQGSGSIINLSSMIGKVGMAGASVYVASKHAVEGLTKSAALEVAQAGVRVNAVAPLILIFRQTKEPQLHPSEPNVPAELNCAACDLLYPRIACAKTPLDRTLMNKSLAH